MPPGWNSCEVNKTGAFKGESLTCFYEVELQNKLQHMGSNVSLRKIYAEIDREKKRF